MEHTVAVGDSSLMAKSLFKTFFMKGKEVESLLSNLECSL